MVKIDLSGKGGWQGKTGNVDLEKGNYDLIEMLLVEDNIDLTWMKVGLIVQVKEGTLTWRLSDEEMIYEAGEIIYLNEENIRGVELIFSKEIKLTVFRRVGDK